jgi:hypothetical protein
MILSGYRSYYSGRSVSGSYSFNPAKYKKGTAARLLKHLKVLQGNRYRYVGNPRGIGPFSIKKNLRKILRLLKR